MRVAPPGIKDRNIVKSKHKNRDHEQQRWPFEPGKHPPRAYRQSRIQTNRLGNMDGRPIAVGVQVRVETRASVRMELE
jgi:hypothetical protein